MANRSVPAEKGRLLEARELRYFVVLAEELHFAGAAQRLTVAAPVLSRAIRRIEADLGVALFRRDTHTVELTDAGAALLPSARAALAGFDEALVAVRQAARLELEGVLNVGASPLMRHRLAPAVFERFAALCPAVRVQRREELSGPLVQELIAHRIDVALAFCPPRHHGLVYQPIRDAELAVLLASSHPLASRSSVSLSALDGEQLLVPSVLAAPDLRRRLDELFAARGLRPAYAPRAIDHDEEMTAVAHGLGVALISRFCFEVAPPGTALLALRPPPALDFELVRRAGPPSPALARFVEAVEDVAAEPTAALIAGRLSQPPRRAAAGR
jgi:DNA-binding transcriptional LysR family regulator